MALCARRSVSRDRGPVPWRAAAASEAGPRGEQRPPLGPPDQCVICCSFSRGFCSGSSGPRSRTNGLQRTRCAATACTGALVGEQEPRPARPERRRAARGNCSRCKFLVFLWSSFHHSHQTLRGCFGAFGAPSSAPLLLS